MDFLSKSDPICVVFNQPFGTSHWTELKRTECNYNNLNPDFATKIPITYHFEEQQHLKFQVYDIDSSSLNLEDHDFIGEYQCTLAQLVSCSYCSYNRLVNREYGGNNGTIILVAEELNSCKEELSIQFIGRNLENRNWFSSLDPFLEFYKVNEDGTFTLVHRGQPARSTKSPIWKAFNVPLRTFCSGDHDRNIKVNCKDYQLNGSHKLIGVFYTTVRRLIEGPGERNTYVLNKERKVGCM